MQCVDCVDGTECHMNCGPVMDVECKFCWGARKIHSSGRNGDPWDKGEDCPKCHGSGVVLVNCETGDEIDDEE